MFYYVRDVKLNGYSYEHRKNTKVKNKAKRKGTK